MTADIAPNIEVLQGGTYARSKRALMAMINEIRAIGAAVDVDLPTIVVAGNQSSGKSSLIEAISGINLPRAAGTCTRVPIEVRLKEDDKSEWTCSIKVRREGSDRSEVEVRRPEVEFGSPITDRSLVEPAIRRAQLAVLNPSVPLQAFVTYKLPEEEEIRPLGSKRQYQFSKDVIVLEISGPHETDLTLVDLPGIIQNVGQNEDKSNIGLIEDMVTSYIRKDCLILLVITMKDDIQNQKAALLAREVDPHGRRTIGVLTKVDTVRSKADIDIWLKVVMGLREPLAHGYYVTRQPDPDELADGITFEQARENEQAFFKTTTPWKDLDDPLRMRLGTKNLAQFLSVEKQISDGYKQVASELDALGLEPPKDATGAMISLVTDFTRAIDDHVSGAPTFEGFMRDFNAMSAAFKEDIRKTRPTFSSKKRTHEQAVAREAAGQTALEASMLDHEATIYVDDMRFHIEGCRTRELPIQLPPSALLKLIKRSTSTWGKVAMDLLNEVRPTIMEIVNDWVEKEFERYSYGGLPRMVKLILSDQLQHLYLTAMQQIKDRASQEEQPYTQNNEYLIKSCDYSLAQLRGPRVDGIEDNTRSSDEPSSTSAPTHDDHVSTIMTSLAAIGQTGLKEEDLNKLRPINDYETELTLMAEASAYWEVAYKRFIDNIPQLIDYYLLRQLSGKVHAALLAELQILGEDGVQKCREYLEEEPKKAATRRDLRVRRDRLASAKHAVKRFKAK